ncbi:peptidylprolyl isomerase [Brevundimonas sp.]|uniref:peptidylprolyl isomerase n=1 Tax=Brevundimonas sp. TaxID=1871086 RepID=UPI0025C0374C|nr:peptidylprolyl isomerase [Brevundimonas sp.]
MRIRTATVMGALALAACATTATGAEQPRVVLETDAGRMVLALDLDRAPLSTCNFLAYVTDGDYDGGSFFRTVVRQTNANPYPIDVIQAATPRGSDDDSRPPIPLERTRDIGLRHVAGAVSMARDGPDTATSSFFIVTQDTPVLDFGGGRNPDGQGFAAFGHLVEGLDVARRIQMSPANGQEQLTPPVVLRSARIVGEVPAQCRP